MQWKLPLTRWTLLCTDEVNYEIESSDLRRVLANEINGSAFYPAATFTQDMFFLMFAITCLTTTETISSDQNFLPQTFLNLLLSANKCTEDFLLLYYLTAELNYMQQLHIASSQ